MRTSFEFANEHLLRAAQKQKTYYDKNIKHREYEPNDYVWRWHPPTAGLKLGLCWIGPYKILRKCSETTYRIQKLPGTPPIVVHVDHLKPYCGTLPSSNWGPNQSDEPDDSETENESF